MARTSPQPMQGQQSIKGFFTPNNSMEKKRVAPEDDGSQPNARKRKLDVTSDDQNQDRVGSVEQRIPQPFASPVAVAASADRSAAKRAPAALQRLSQEHSLTSKDSVVRSLSFEDIPIEKKKKKRKKKKPTPTSQENGEPSEDTDTKPAAEPNPKTWTQKRQALLEKFSDNAFLLTHHLGQLKLEQERASAATTNQPPQVPEMNQAQEEVNDEAPEPVSVSRLSEAQRLVAEHPPDIPLSVRAGAGTGKTQTMVTRAIKLVSLHSMNPENILMLTFTNKAASEMRERIQAEFAKAFPDQALTLPNVKTFHSLAYRWIRSFWKRCGMGKYPNLLVTKIQQRSFMQRVIETHLKRLQLKQCGIYLKNKQATWSDVIDKMRCLYPAQFSKALENAEAKVTKKKNKKESKTKKEGAKKKTEAEKRREAELKVLLDAELGHQCYLELLRLKKNDPTAKCKLESTWTASSDQCNMYLKLVEKARLGQHDPSEYLPKDADILRLYDSEQERTGQIDFDKLLNLFVQLLEKNTSIQDAFREHHKYVIVDEYQDNSEVQSTLLLKIVTQGKVTVVGDDDQCIYEFRGACPGNFQSFQKHYVNLSTNGGYEFPSPRQRFLEDNYRSTSNILAVGKAFLQGMSFDRGGKTLTPTREAGDKVELWTCR